MIISEHTTKGVTVLDLDGNLTRDENSEFRRFVNAVIDAGQHDLILNLAGVTSMDSCGLGELISCYTALQRVKGRVKLLSPNHRLKNLLFITKLDTVFEMFDSESKAVDSFANKVSPEVFPLTTV